MLVVRSSLGVNTFKEFIAYARANPGKVKMGSPGNGTYSHMTQLALQDLTGVDYTIVPYRVPPQVLQAAARVDGRNRSRTVTAVHVVRKGESLWAIAKRYNMDVSALAKLNRIDPKGTLRSGQKLKLHGTVQTSSKSTAASSGDGRRVTYVVRSGDTLSSIARSLRVSVNNLREWNNIAGSAIRAGQKLVAFVPSRS